MRDIAQALGHEITFSFFIQELCGTVDMVQLDLQLHVLRDLQFYVFR